MPIDVDDLNAELGAAERAFEAGGQRREAGLDVDDALAYYQNHPREMRTIEADRDAAIAAVRTTIDRTDGVTPPADR